MIFINRERIATLKSKFHFQIEDWNLPTVGSFKVTNVDCIVTCVSQKFTREIRNHWRLLVSVSFTRQGIFRNFQEHFLCIYSTLVFKKYSSQFYNSKLLHHAKKYLQLIFCWANTNHIRHNSLPLAREHLSDVNNKPISIPHLEQGTTGTTSRQQSATCTWTFVWCQ